MFKQQVSPRCKQPYQTRVPGAPLGQQRLTPAAQDRIKPPWAEDINPPFYQVTGTDSSASDNAYHVPHHYNDDVREYGSPSPVYHSPCGTGTWRSYKRGEKSTMQMPSAQAYTFPECASVFSQPIYDVEACVKPVGCSPVPPVSSLTPEVPMIGACGGHCPGFEYVCHYILQVIFVVGILTGISLCIAGIVLRRTNRNGDLGVLLYIGSLCSCVCCVLLCAQCCARREARRRRRRAGLAIPAIPAIPMRSVQEPSAPAFPLLSSTLPHNQVYRPTTNVCQEDVAGIPWWRRTERD